jgi:hypothetical protein
MRAAAKGQFKLLQGGGLCVGHGSNPYESVVRAARTLGFARYGKPCGLATFGKVARVAKPVPTTVSQFLHQVANTFAVPAVRAMACKVVKYGVLQGRRYHHGHGGLARWVGGGWCLT